MAAPSRDDSGDGGEPPAKRSRLNTGVVKKRAVFLSDDSFGSELAAGAGAAPGAPHGFSSGVFDSREAFDQYASDSGLEATGVEQQWGDGRGEVHRSRRGSLGGFQELPSGRVAAWRWSSHATSRGLQAQAEGRDPFAAYERKALAIGSKAKNSRGRAIPPNAIVSEAGHVAFDAASGSFSLEQVSHAQGLSAAGVDWRRSDRSPAAAYGHTRRAAAAAGVKPTPSHSHHSEGMALGFHDEVRQAPLSASSDLLMMATSIPNQVCKNCGRAFQQGLGAGSYVAGMPGRPFGGQKVGQTDAPSSSDGATVFRAEPTIALLPSTPNRTQIGAIFDAQARGVMQPGGMGAGPAAPALMPPPAAGGAGASGTGPALPAAAAAAAPASSGSPSPSPSLKRPRE